MIKIIKEANVEELRDFMYNKFPEDSFDDKKLYECLNAGRAINVFQMSAGTASGVVERVVPRNMSELTACNAFARPGTIDSLPAYIEGKDGRLKYRNEIINSIFGETFGVCLYQEEIMKLFSSIMEDRSVGNVARGLLKKLGKKDKKQSDIDAWKELTNKLAEKAIQKGVGQSELKLLLEDVATLANYSFNKSHALAYSMMAAWTLYLNVYFKKFYYPAVIEYAFEHDKETESTLKEMRRNGFNIHSPSINESKARTFSNNDDIYIGLHNLKQVGSAAENIVSKAPYSSFREFMEKNMNDSAVNKRAISALVSFGCFDNIETTINRNQMISAFNYFWEKKPTIKKISAEDAQKIKSDDVLREKLITAFNKKSEEILSFWDEIKSSAEKNTAFAVKDTQDFLKECEAKYLGFNFFVTPFSSELRVYLNEKINKGVCVDGFESLRRYKNISKVVPVYISDVREYNDKNGNKMCFLSLADMNGDEIRLPIFASVYGAIEDKVSAGVIALMLLYNTDDNYHGGEQIMFGTKKWVDADKCTKFIIPIRSNIV